MVSEYKPTVDDIKGLLKRIPENYVPECLKPDRYDEDRFLWLDNMVYLKQKTGTPWEEIKDLEGEELTRVLFPP